MAAGKWIPEIKADTPTVDAARRVLGLRLEGLRDAVGGALQQTGDDLEGVHQLRVATRRASAALKIFSGCLDRKTYRNTAQKVRELRRAAGAARDWDVFLLQLCGRLKKTQAADAPMLDLLCGFALAHRIPAQTHLEQACSGYPFEFERWMSRALSAITPPPLELARTETLAKSRLAEQYSEMRQRLEPVSASYEELHELRICTKRMRYSMELFAGCFSEEFSDELYSAVGALQEILGGVNDAHVGLGRLESLQHGLETLYPKNTERWSHALAGIIHELKKDRIEGLQQLEGWKATAVKSSFDSRFRTLLGISVERTDSVPFLLNEERKSQAKPKEFPIHAPREAESPGDPGLTPVVGSEHKPEIRSRSVRRSTKAAKAS